MGCDLEKTSEAEGRPKVISTKKPREGSKRKDDSENNELFTVSPKFARTIHRFNCQTRPDQTRGTLLAIILRVYLTLDGKQRRITKARPCSPHGKGEVRRWRHTAWQLYVCPIQTSCSNECIHQQHTESFLSSFDGLARSPRASWASRTLPLLKDYHTITHVYGSVITNYVGTGGPVST
ncbi:unnamed protein product [Nesidiocoris tenuis]|uniref:Uncharacterized protein n=1 Tax=Nesidiocoris tenuis TaxID=355587 RepID=A0A6H5HIU9_9HEMI|nr:unnamed protein product [Nesidiocoris tenuis]